MTSIDRTAYPQFRRLTSARVLHVFFTPTAEEIGWAKERTAGQESLFALVLALKCFQKMARFCPLEEIPEAVTGHVRRCLGLDPETAPDHGAARTAKWHRRQVRVRQGVTYDQRRARALAAREIRAHHYISDTYVALFSRFIPCGVWQAVHVIEGLLANDSDIQPSTVHADTQGQSAPVFTLATLFGFDLMPRIRNFQDLIFFRASGHLIYPHIDELFGERGRNVIDWQLIERHWRDLMQVTISISEGRLSSATLMRRLRSNSRKNRIYKVFREVGRSVRTVALLRYLADPQLRARVTAATNKAESYHCFAQWLGFGNNGVLADNDPQAGLRITVKRARIPQPGEPDALTKTEQGRVERAAARRGLRDRAIVATLLYAGARAGECGRLDADDVTLTTRTGHIRLHGKGDEVHTVPLPPVGREHLAAWLDERGTHDGPLWTGQRGRLTISGITQVILAVGEDAGIPGLRPHRLRHTYATRQGGADPRPGPGSPRPGLHRNRRPLLPRRQRRTGRHRRPRLRVTSKVRSRRNAGWRYSVPAGPANAAGRSVVAQAPSENSRASGFANRLFRSPSLVSDDLRNTSRKTATSAGIASRIRNSTLSASPPGGCSATRADHQVTWRVAAARASWAPRGR